jgi:outer membrane protein OmpA-like peptidoglycan-associated protein
MVRATIAALVGFSMMASAQPLLAQTAGVSQADIKRLMSDNEEAESPATPKSTTCVVNMETGEDCPPETKSANLAGRLGAVGGIKNTANTGITGSAGGRSTANSGYAPSPVAVRHPITPAPIKRLNMRLEFEKSSAELTADARKQADVFADGLIKFSGTKRFLIEGHTDSKGPRALNLALSQERAQSVVNYLVSKGVPENKLRAKGYASDRPRDGLKASDSRNRRVEIARD